MGSKIIVKEINKWLEENNITSIMVTNDISWFFDDDEKFDIELSCTIYHGFDYGKLITDKQVDVIKRCKNVTIEEGDIDYTTKTAAMTIIQFACKHKFQKFQIKVVDKL